MLCVCGSLTKHLLEKKSICKQFVHKNISLYRKNKLPIETPVYTQELQNLEGRVIYCKVAHSL